MASMEKISADLKHVDSKKENLRKAFEHSLLLLTLQWKDLEEYFDSTRKSIEQRFYELKSKEKQFDSFQLSLKKLSSELNSIQKSIEESFKELRLKEEKLDLTRLSIEERSKELDSVEESINESFKELGNKEKELNSVQKSIDHRVEEFELKEKQFEKCFKELELKEKQFDSIQKSIENRFKELEGKEKRYQERDKQLELKEKRYEELSKSLELKQKERECVLRAKVKVEEPEYVPVNNAIHSSSSANIRFCITMDGKTLQLFLNERLNNHDSMRDEVYAALRMSSDPAKLVLDAMQGFYPPFSKKGNMEFEGSIVRRSCTLLLAQLMRVSPHITPLMREEAMKLAIDWKAKLKVESENSLEALGFLLLVGAYGLISGFDRNEMFKLFETTAQHREAPGLCRALGFADKVPDFIQRLINRRQNLAAIRFIFAFELVRKFHPIPILEVYYKYWKKIADKTCEGENKLSKEQFAIAKRTIAALKAVVRCIKDHKLETEHSLESLEKIIAVLNKKANNGCIVPAAPRPQLQPQSEKKCDAHDSIPKIQTQQKSRIKRLREAVPEDTPNAPVCAASTIRSVHSPHQQPADLSANEDMIQGLIEGRRNLEAIKFIFEFELVGKFPPAPILEDYYKYWKKTADEICERENNLTREQITIAKKSIAALKAVIRCIEDHKLETEHSTESIEKFIVVLRKKANSGFIVPGDPKPQQQPQSVKKCDASSDSIPKTEAEQQSKIKRRRKSVSKDTPNHPIRVTSTIHSIHTPRRSPGGFFTDEGAPYLGSSAGWYMSSYPNSPVSFFTRNAQREPGYHDGPISFPGPMDTLWEPDYYDGPPPFGSPRCALGEPDIYDVPVPLGDYDLPPPFHPPFYPC